MPMSIASRAANIGTVKGNKCHHCDMPLNHGYDIELSSIQTSAEQGRRGAWQCPVKVHLALKKSSYWVLAKDDVKEQAVPPDARGTAWSGAATAYSANSCARPVVSGRHIPSMKDLAPATGALTCPAAPCRGRCVRCDYGHMWVQAS